MANKNGETRMANNGQKMTIVEYRGSEDIDVQFEVLNKLNIKYFFYYLLFQ